MTAISAMWDGARDVPSRRRAKKPPVSAPQVSAPTVAQRGAPTVSEPTASVSDAAIA